MCALVREISVIAGEVSRVKCLACYCWFNMLQPIKEGEKRKMYTRPLAHKLENAGNNECYEMNKVESGALWHHK